MKWLNIKNNIPQTNTQYLIFTKDNYTCVGHLEDENTPDVWIHDYYCDAREGYSWERIYSVTHFCLIEPVKIDEIKTFVD